MSGQWRTFSGRRTTLQPVGDVPLLFQRLVDDAALFPPGNAPMSTAVPAHLRRPTEPFAALVGPFLCPASRIAELRSELPADVRMAVGLIVDTGLDSVVEAIAAVRADERLELRMVEVPVPADEDLDAGAARAMAQVPAEVKLYVELPRVGRLASGAGAPRCHRPRGQAAHRRAPSRAVPVRRRAGGLRHGVRRAAGPVQVHRRPPPRRAPHRPDDRVRAPRVPEPRRRHGAGDPRWRRRGRPGRGAAGALGRRGAAIDPPGAAATRALFVSYGSCDVRGARGRPPRARAADAP